MSICPRCGTAFECGMAGAVSPDEPCWCTRLPALPVDAYLPVKGHSASSRCFCPYCLRALLATAEVSKREER
jgi:hypothetical protein